MIKWVRDNEHGNYPKVPLYMMLLTVENNFDRTFTQTH